MGYRKIPNLYKNKEILLFKQCVASEKCHGTSAHVGYRVQDDSLYFFSGCVKHNNFINLFDRNNLLDLFRKNCADHPDVNKIVVFGEAYGGKIQKMSSTYGSDLKFIAFEIRINDEWMGHFSAENIITKLGFDFVPYNVIDTTEDAINSEMMADSVIAVRNGMGSGHMREGIVLRPLIELMHQNGGRIISKHKRPEFAERTHTPKFSDPEKLKVLEDAVAIANEWVVMERLRHVLGAFPNPKIEDADKIIKAMVQDVYCEAAGEIVENKAVRKAIGRKTVKLLKELIRSELF